MRILPTNRSRLSCTLLIVFVLSSLVVPIHAEPGPPSARDRQIAITVSALLKREHLSKHEDHWVEIMMAHELQLQPVEHRGLIPTALLVGFSAFVGSLDPLAPFFFLPVGSAIWVSLAVSALALFAVGAFKARITIGKPTRSGLQMATIGIASALAGYAIGALFGMQ